MMHHGDFNPRSDGLPVAVQKRRSKRGDMSMKDQVAAGCTESSVFVLAPVPFMIAWLDDRLFFSMHSGRTVKNTQKTMTTRMNMRTRRVASVLKLCFCIVIIDCYTHVAAQDLIVF